MKRIISAWEVIKFNVLLKIGLLAHMGKPMGNEEGKEAARQDYLDMLNCMEAFGNFQEAERIRATLKTF